mgnify:CR=1 FL=1
MDSRTLTPAARDFRFRLTRLARTALMIGVALPAAALAQDAGQIAASTPCRRTGCRVISAASSGRSRQVMPP